MRDYEPARRRCEYGCGRALLLFGRVAGRLMCPFCWLKRGCPLPDAIGKAHELEEQTRKNMQRRRGTDRHLVRNGMS